MSFLREYEIGKARKNPPRPQAIGAIRQNMRAGIPVGMAMKLSDHRTMSVFERYNITDEKDLQKAAELRHKRI